MKQSGSSNQKSEYCKVIDDLVNAFVALGGNSDGTGFITKNKLIDIMKNEFELPVDINTTV